MAKPTETQTKRAEGLRRRAKDRIRADGLNPSKAARAAGVIVQTMSQFLKDRTPSDETMDLVEAWLNGSTRSTHGATGEDDRNAEFWKRYDAIEALPISEIVKIHKVAELAAVIRARVMELEVEAGRERTRERERETNRAAKNLPGMEQSPRPRQRSAKSAGGI